MARLIRAVFYEVLVKLEICLADHARQYYQTYYRKELTLLSLSQYS